MAKQRRDRSAPAKPQSRRSASSSSADRPHDRVDKAAELRREAFREAVALYERGMQALQAHDYSRASEILTSVLDQFPDEHDLHERVHLYLKVCARQAAPAPAAPQTLEERVYAATLALNEGRTDDALRHLQSVLETVPDHDHAHYMLALVRAHRGELDAAAAALHEAVALNSENRLLARQDPDLESLREMPDVRALLDTPAGDRRRPPRSRSAH